MNSTTHNPQNRQETYSKSRSQLLTSEMQAEPPLVIHVESQGREHSVAQLTRVVHSKDGDTRRSLNASPNGKTLAMYTSCLSLLAQHSTNRL